MENTFWELDINRRHDGNFVELFKKSFTLYVKSGMRDKIERDIDILRNEEGELLVTDSEDFNEKFYKFIVDHYLRKFFVSNCTRLLNTARPGESASGEQKKEKKFSLLKKLMRKFHRDKEHDRA